MVRKHLVLFVISMLLTTLPVMIEGGMVVRGAGVFLAMILVEYVSCKYNLRFLIQGKVFVGVSVGVLLLKAPVAGLQILSCLSLVLTCSYVAFAKVYSKEDIYLKNV